MTIIEIGGAETTLTRTQRWGHFFTLGLAVSLFLLGLNARNNALNAVTPYTNIQAGIQVAYPQNWLIDENGADYIFRVRDMARVGFKTTIQIDVESVGTETQEWNVLTRRAVSRSVNLATFQPFGIEDFELPDETIGARMDYTFTATDPNPALESVPIVVIGTDILTIRRGQAITITFLADADTYDDDFAVFERFLESLGFQ